MRLQERQSSCKVSIPFFHGSSSKSNSSQTGSFRPSLRCASLARQLLAACFTQDALVRWSMFDACEIYERQSNCSLSEHSLLSSLLLALTASASRPSCLLLSLVAPSLSSLGPAAQARKRILCNNSEDFGPYCVYCICCDGNLRTGSRPPVSSGHRTAAALHQRLYSSERFSSVQKRPRPCT